MIILGFELFKKAIIKTLINDDTLISNLGINLIIFSLILKIIMYLIYNYSFLKTKSVSLKIVSQDSKNDLILTIVSIIALMIEKNWQFKIDAYFAILVSLYIVYSAYQLIKETIDLLIGKKIDNIAIKDYILSFNEIEEVHDLHLHQYVFGCKFGVCDVVMKERDYLKIHNLIDHIEYQIKKIHQIEMRIHVDPFSTLNQELIDVIKKINPNLKAHDFYLDHYHQKISFDIVSDWDNVDIKKEESLILNEIKKCILIIKLKLI